MKGIIFNLLQESVTGEYGDEAWEKLLENTELDGAYTSLGNYPDEHLTKLVASASSLLQVPPDSIIRWFGRNALPLLAKRYPQFFQGHKSTRTFLLTLNDVIHTEVRKLYPGAEVPDFDYDTASPDILQMGYKSPRKLCALAEGFVQAAANHFGEEVLLEQPKCMLRGDDKCVFRMSFRKLAA